MGSAHYPFYLAGCPLNGLHHFLESEIEFKLRKNEH